MEHLCAMVGDLALRYRIEKQTAVRILAARLPSTWIKIQQLPTWSAVAYRYSKSQAFSKYNIYSEHTNVTQTHTQPVSYAEPLPRTVKNW